MVAAILMVAFLPFLAWAEVMDKEPTLVEVWAQALVLGVVGLFAWRRHLGLGVVATVLAAVFVWSFYWELTDAYVGPAIVVEAGRAYVGRAYAAMGTCAILHLLGLAANFRGRLQHKRAHRNTSTVV